MSDKFYKLLIKTLNNNERSLKDNDLTNFFSDWFYEMDNESNVRDKSRANYNAELINFLNNALGLDFVIDHYNFIDENSSLRDWQNLHSIFLSQKRSNEFFEKLLTQVNIEHSIGERLNLIIKLTMNKYYIEGNFPDWYIKLIKSKLSNNLYIKKFEVNDYNWVVEINVWDFQCELLGWIKNNINNPNVNSLEYGIFIDFFNYYYKK